LHEKCGPKSGCFLTIFTTHLTTQKPQNYHVQPPVFLKIPSKIALSTTAKNPAVFYEFFRSPAASKTQEHLKK
jgi:hypothetical protein